MNLYTFECAHCGEDLVRHHRHVIESSGLMFCDADCAVKFLIDAHVKATEEEKK